MDVKSIFKSITFWGAVTTLVGQFAPKFMAALGSDPSVVAQYVVTAIGFVVTVIGRLRATQPVSFTGK